MLTFQTSKLRPPTSMQGSCGRIPVNYDSSQSHRFPVFFHVFRRHTTTTTH